MKLPWSSNEVEEKEERIEELEQRLEELEDKRDSWRKRFESEKERRKELSRKKQEVEEEINRLKDKLQNTEEKSKESSENRDRDSERFKPVSYGKARSILEKLDSMESGEKELVTVYSPGKVDELEDLRGLKNSITSEQFSTIREIEGFVSFLDQDTGNTLLKMSPFFDSRFVIEEFFDIAELLEFFRSEKHWAIVSAGETIIYREQDGDYQEVERIKSRVDREHSKGGFSQGRFERKRDEQIENHVDEVETVLNDLDTDEIYLLGDERLCSELPGEHLGGFDPNRKKPEQFYRFQLMRF